ncbi:unnamed protein product [Paramecium octaurelia]|uniref:Uncharacterized protein n=1 Tax=Paramecium octaurelia TaxID=43137 RepID=A0A8S1XA63_PAROT|nr:unnamed protein product [Paramecium octaurelia]
MEYIFWEVDQKSKKENGYMVDYMMDLVENGELGQSM